MIKHSFSCPHCEKEIWYSLFHLSASLTCPHCGKQYIVNKNRMILMVEIVVLMSLAFLLREFVQAAGVDHYVLEMLLVIIMLLFVNAVFDIVFTKVLKWNRYFVLIEKTIQK